jgi:hypothetical protein
MAKKKIVRCHWASSTVAVGPIGHVGQWKRRTGDVFPLPRHRRYPAKSGWPTIDDRWGMGRGPSPVQGGSNLGRWEDGISPEQCSPCRWGGRLEGNGMVGWCPVGSVRWLAWRANPQPRTTQRCTRRQQWLLAVVLGSWNRGGWQEAERRERGESGGAEREEV